jgi:hypothetical protein
MVDASGLTTGQYRDRHGQAFDLNVTFSTSTSLWTAHLGDAVEGTYTAMLSDGRTLTGRFRACILTIFLIA